MESIIMTIIKTIYINTSVMYMFYKIRGIDKLENKQSIKVIIGIIIGTIICFIANKYISGYYGLFIGIIAQCFIARIIENERKESVIMSVLISSAIVHMNFVIAAFIESLIRTLIINLKEYNTLNLLLIIIISTIINIQMFKIKRINKGFQFLKEKINNEYLGIIVTNICIFVIFAYFLFGKYNTETAIQIMVTFALVSVIMIVMISKTIALAYKQKQLEKNLAEDDKIIKQKDAEIESLSKEKFEISKVSHEFEKRIKALELKAISNMNMEVSEENDLMKQINNLSKEYSTKLKQIKGSDKLKKTEVDEIDNMFEYLQNECEKSNIEFYLNINCDVNNMIDKVIAKNKLETLIGDLGTDAIHAVNMSKNNYKSIVTIIDKQEDIYLISMSDTGVEFKIDTLLKLGLEPATTHKEDGGSGIGYITTFETLNETKASLIIEEKNNESENEYTKTITVKFDGRNEYKIISYRADEIRKKQRDSRIKVENIKNSDNI